MMFKVGQIYFWNSNEDLFGKAITFYNKRTFKRSDATHVGIIGLVEDKRVYIFEAGAKGFIGSWYDKDFFNRENVHIGECKENLNDVYFNCLKYENIKYGWLDIIAIGLSALFGWRVLGITGKNAIICSEAVSRVLYDSSKTVDFAKEYGIKFDAVTPQHIFLSKQVRIIK